jgi:hypothetical protein
MYAQRNPRWEDFDYKYLNEMDGNPMTWLGNGYTISDYDGSSRTTYLDRSLIDYPPIPDLEVNGNSHMREDPNVKSSVAESVVLLPATTAA